MCDGGWDGHSRVHLRDGCPLYLSQKNGFDAAFTRAVARESVWSVPEAETEAEEREVRAMSVLRHHYLVAHRHDQSTMQLQTTPLLAPLVCAAII